MKKEVLSKKRKKKQKSIAICILPLIMTLLMSQVVFSEKKKLKATKKEVSREIRQNLKIRQGLQKPEVNKDDGKVGSVAQINWDVRRKRQRKQFEADCQLSGGTYNWTGGLGTCCWHNWGCLSCNYDGDCTMDCQTQECEDAQLLSPKLFREVAKEVNMLRDPSKETDDRRINKKIKNQILSLDRKTNKIIKEGRLLIKKNKMICLHKKTEVIKNHKRLVEIVWEIRHNLKERKALLNQLQR